MCGFKSRFLCLGVRVWQQWACWFYGTPVLPVEKLLEAPVEKLLTSGLWKDTGLSTWFVTGLPQGGRAVFGRRGMGFWQFCTVSTGPTTTATTPLILILLLEQGV